jgi:hypothetical protein
MADKTDTAGTTGRMIEAVSRLLLEYQAARYVLRTSGPPNWAKLLHDWRVSPNAQDDVQRRIHARIAALPPNPSTSEILTILVEAIDDTVPLYPSQTNH